MASPPVHPGAAGPEYWFDEGCHIRELWNQTADAEVSIARARVPVGTTTRWHVLTAITERYLIEAGRGRVEVGEAPAVAVGPGDVVVIPPGVRQRITAEGTEDLCFLAVCTPRFQPEAYSEAD